MNFNLRKARKSDLLFYFKLRNKPGVRKQMLNSNPIDLNKHKVWFLAKLAINTSLLYIMLVNSKKAGQIRIDVDKSQGELDISLLPKFRGYGLGTKAIKKLCELSFKKFPTLEVIRAYIKMENKASQKIFLNAGFSKTGYANRQRQRCIKMALKVIGIKKS